MKALIGYLLKMASGDLLQNALIQKIPTVQDVLFRSTLATIRPQVANWQICVEQAKAYLQQALEHADSLEVGQGFGPVHHFHRWW